MEIKFELDTEKVANPTVAIAAFCGPRGVSEGTKLPQLALAVALITIIAILYGPRPVPKAKEPT
jgi:hypothetical protein